MANEKKRGFETELIHAGQVPDPTENSRGDRDPQVPRPSSSRAPSTRPISSDSRNSGTSTAASPTRPTRCSRSRVTALEGGAASVTAASGTAAIFNTIVTIARVGDEIVSASNLYGGTYTLFDAIFPDLGINTKFVDVKRPRELREGSSAPRPASSTSSPSATRPSTSRTSPPSPRSPRNTIIPLVVDNTFATPYLLKSPRTRSRHRHRTRSPSG